MTQLILFNVTNGLIIGAFYVLMALGLSLILNLSNVINFAHGNFLALGGYLAFTLSPTLGYWGALLVSPLLTALIGLAVERLMIRRIYNRDPVYSLLAHLRTCLRDAGRGALHLGPERLADGPARRLGAADHRRPVLHHLLPHLHGDGRHRRRGRAVRLPAPLPRRPAHPRRNARSRDRVDAGRQRSAICAPSISPWAACWPA